MTEKDILDNAPEGATHYSAELDQYWGWITRTIKPVDNMPLEDVNYPDDLHLLSDIKRIAELEEQLQVSQPEFLNDLNCYARITSDGDIPMPTGVDMAKYMLLISHSWLRDNAPNEIKPSQPEWIRPESVQAIIDYIDEDNPDLEVVKGELGELIARYNGTYYQPAPPEKGQ